MNKEIDPNELWDILDEDVDYKKAVEASRDLDLIIKRIIRYYEQFNPFDSPNLVSELSLGLGHLVMASKFIEEYVEDIVEDRRGQYFLDNYEPTDEELARMKNQSK
jgi:hypothetical protein